MTFNAAEKRMKHRVVLAHERTVFRATAATVGSNQESEFVELLPPQHAAIDFYQPTSWPIGWGAPHFTQRLRPQLSSLARLG